MPEREEDVRSSEMEKDIESRESAVEISIPHSQLEAWKKLTFGFFLESDRAGATHRDNEQICFVSITTAKMSSAKLCFNRKLNQ